MFHYSGSIIPTIRPNPLEEVLDPARFGVQVFFVISGFVIPFALQRSGYTTKDLGNFMWRRYLRIAPPAYIAAAFVVLYHALAVWVTGSPVEGVKWVGVDIRSLVGNFIFHPALLGTQWYNFAFWSLMIEFQFYLLIGALLPWMLRGNSVFRITVISLAMILLKLVDDYWFFEYAPYFVMGMIVFFLQHGSIGRKPFALLLVSASAICLWEGDLVALIFALIATGIILSKLEVEWKALILLGDISYSLYITHVPIAYFAGSLLARITDIHQFTLGKLFLLFIYIGIALLGAWLFHQHIEHPFRTMSKKARKEGTVIPAA